MMTLEAIFRKGCALYGAGRHADAEAAFRTCMAQHPENPDVLNALASALGAQGKTKEAILYLNQACSLRPDCAPFRHNLANMLRRQHDRVRAEREYVEAIRLDPSLAVAFHGLGSLYLEDDMLDSAEACLQQAVQLAPALAPALHDLGQLRQLQGRDGDAEPLYRQAVAADRGYLPALNSLGMLLLRMNKVGEARNCFENAININPSYLQARCNLGVLATWTGELDKAIGELQQVTAAAPEDGDAHFNLSLALLAAGRFEEGWREHEWRFRKAKPVPKRHEQIPRWTGQPVEGRRILIHSEQGYGDSLQFIRYATTLADRGATVLVEGQDRQITPLLATVPGIAAAFSREDAAPAADLQVPMMSLPLPLGPAAWPPPPPPYLFPPAECQRIWQERLAALGGIKVGLAWAGRPEHQNDANRSLSSEMLCLFEKAVGISFVSLQFGNRVESGSLRLYDPAGEVHDFLDSAALISALDLVVTVDSAVAHLAGGLNLPVWLLLPWNPDWRWQHGRSDSPWYPRTKVYRQPAPGNWRPVVEEVISDLCRLDLATTRGRTS